MKCRLFLPLLAIWPTRILGVIRAYNVIIGVLNITGNSLLIWGLCKTRQTSTISLQFMILMSISDLISGISGLVLLTLYTWDQYGKSCWFALSTQFILATCSMYSLSMIVLVAFDRYLHMKHLERYNLVVTKKRGYFLAIASFFATLSINIILMVPLPSKIYASLLIGLSASLFPTLCLVLWLYYNALRELRMRANQATRRIYFQSKALGRAAKRITICIAVLTIPTTVLTILGEITEPHGVEVSVEFKTVRWLAYITYLSNAFWSSFIFMSQNRPIRQICRRYVSRIRPAV